MIVLLKKLLQNRAVSYGWTLLIIVLLCLPGSYVPGDGFFGIPQLDKVAHIILFGVNVIVWYGYSHSGNPGPVNNAILLKITLLTILFGIVMEFVQMYFVPRRSFDGYDIIADIVGALAGAWMSRRLTVES